MSRNKKVQVVILAAGRGSRMYSNTPKVMYKIGSKYIIQHLIDTVEKIEIQSIYIVYGYQGNMVIQSVDLKNRLVPIYWILQKDLLGTGHAVKQVLPCIHNEDDIIVLLGDVPLISSNTLERLISIKEECDIGLVTTSLENPDGYGRIVRNEKGNIIRIIEDKDIICSYQRKIKEVNTGIFITVARNLKKWLKKISMFSDLKKEYYITEIISIACDEGYVIKSIRPNDNLEVMGINNKWDLTYVSREYQKRQARDLLYSGLLLSDPDRFDLRGVLKYGEDVNIDIDVIIEGNVVLGNRVQIGSGCILRNAIVLDDVIIHPFSIVENAKIGSKSVVGPFAQLRFGTELQEKSCVGNFVELKNTKLGRASKVKHLSYLGDTEVGATVNIGAGTVICNYDGCKKHNTTIGDGVFIGANSQLIAPVNIGNKAIIGAGTTVTRDVSEGDIVISRIRQFSILNTRSCLKKKK